VIHLFSVDIPTPRSSAICLRESPLVSAIRTASLRNSSVLTVPMVHLLCCTLRDQRSGTKPRQDHKALIGMEACPGSQWLARRLIEMGHDARIIPARFVKPYVKSNKTDTVDAAAIAEAVTRPIMRFVEVRTPVQVDLQALHRIRDRLVGQRTGLMNQAGAFCIEYGLAMRIGAGGFHADIRRHLANPENDLTQNMRALLNDLLDDLAYIEGRVKALSVRIEAIANEDETIRRLLTIPGIGALGT
jgi:transposase